MCQQAAEKILKSLYLKKYGELRKIHDLAYFAKKLNLSEDLIEKCEELTKAYVETRYPDLGSGKIPAKKFSKDDAKNLVMATKAGIIKKTAMSEFENLRASGLIAIKLRSDDALISVKKSFGESSINENEKFRFFFSIAYFV